MITVTVLVIVGIVVRLAAYWDEPATPLIALALTLAAAALTFLGGTIGGTLAYDYGFNVEAAGDSPVWHPSETDVFPGDKHTLFFFFFFFFSPPPPPPPPPPQARRGIGRLADIDGAS